MSARRTRAIGGGGGKTEYAAAAPAIAPVAGASAAVKATRSSRQAEIAPVWVASAVKGE